MAEVKLDDFEKEALKRTYKYKCYICGKKDFPKDLSIDHVIPPNKLEQAILEGYITDSFDVDSIYNYAPICGSCNREKSDNLYQKNHILHFLSIVKIKVPEVIKLANELRGKTKISQILFNLTQWEKSGDLYNERVYNRLSAFVEKGTDFGFNNSIILKPTENTKVELLEQKSFHDNDLNDFIQKIQISQEMVFGYSNYGFISLENDIKFYPVSILTNFPPSFFYYRRYYSHDRNDNHFFNIKTQIHAVLLKNNKAVLISISKIDLELEIEQSQLSNYNENQFLFDDIDNQRQKNQEKNNIMRIVISKIIQLNNFSKTVLQYILGLFGNGD